MRLALGIEYDGAGFCGWQSQPNGLAVQDALESALSQLAGHDVRVSAAGRTDTGVHALSQVVHFDTAAVRPQNAWVRGVNTRLPRGVRVLWASEVDARFHARFDAYQRSYQYWLINQPVAPAVMAGKAGWFHQPLDLRAMQEAMAYLQGQHDFSAFRAAECQAKSPVKTMHRASVNAFGSSLVFDFCANAFLHHQVRNMVGALVYIGKGKYPPAFMAELLAAQDRTLSPPTFSPDGLYLTGVGYDARWGLPGTERKLQLGIA
ncbi:tRNA pseudouridine(38-40) synthase TruA [Methylobacillus flagellatus]|uniref:tRNA pseudouridine(38-40) synthase TruA n=1 Tax=Methylobacillus flagellatus TaxID=405 RepID=UPI002853A2C8|nr:tRNA pseudouridine(38-40) synthase TruA [Methylobacillus flagellatus]MDR5171662.1 tRNA pseudouridine(38-40) synthase TruA [Methylobacillus flagellatus]